MRITSLILSTMLGGLVLADDPKQILPDYRPVPHWAKLPDSIQFGLVSAVATDDADNVYVLHRGKQPLVVFDKDGKFLRSWDDEHIKQPHGLRIDRHNNIWITDIANHVVLKFDRSGKRLMVLGKKGKSGDDKEHFNKPTDVAITPAGDFYVSDGYGNARVVKFAMDGRYLLEWGKKGKGQGEFNLPHAIVLDGHGRVYVGDRENSRVQVFDSKGTFIGQWRDGGSPYGLFLTPDERLLIADGRANWITVLNSRGKSIGRWGEKGKSPGQLDTPHMLCVDKRGAVYVADLGNKRVQKFMAK